MLLSSWKAVGRKVVVTFGMLTVVVGLGLSGCSTLTKDRFGKETSREKMEKTSTKIAEASNQYRSGNLDGAEALYLDIIKDDPKNAEAFYRLGNIAFKRGQYQAASGYFARAIDNLPRNAKAHYNLAVTYLTLAEQHFKYYTATAPENTDVANVSDILRDIFEFATFGQAGGQQQRSAPAPDYKPSSGGVPSSSFGDGTLDALEALADEFK